MKRCFEHALFSTCGEEWGGGQSGGRTRLIRRTNNAAAEESELNELPSPYPFRLGRFRNGLNKILHSSHVIIAFRPRDRRRIEFSVYFDAVSARPISRPRPLRKLLPPSFARENGEFFPVFFLSLFTAAAAAAAAAGT